MLQTEVFADAVAFLRLFDLTALAFAIAMCSSRAARASNRIRWDDFPGLHFIVSNDTIQVYRSINAPKESDVSWLLQFVADLISSSEDDLIKFVAAALPNCVFEDEPVFGFLSKHVYVSLIQVTEPFVINGAFRVL